MWFGLFAILFSCAKQAAPERFYSVRKPGKGWKAVREGGADRAWYNQELSAVIYVDTSCGRKFEDRALEDAYRSLTKGIATGDPTRMESLRIDGREGLLLYQPGRLDGVPVELGAAIVSKNGCLFDFLYIAPASSFPTGEEDFLVTVGSLRTNSNKTEGLPQKREKEVEPR